MRVGPRLAKEVGAFKSREESKDRRESVLSLSVGLSRAPTYLPTFPSRGVN